MADDFADLACRTCRRRGRPLRRARRPASPGASSADTARRTRRGPPSSRRRRGCSRSTRGCRLPGPGVLLVTIGIDRRRRRTSAGAARAARRATRLAPSGSVAPPSRPPGGRGRKRLGRALQDELARRQVVVGAAVEPEQLRVALDLGQRRRVDAVSVREDLLEHVAHLEVVRVPLVVERCRARRGPPGRGARSGSSVAAAARRSRPRTAARRPRRRPARAGTCGPAEERSGCRSWPQLMSVVYVRLPNRSVVRSPHASLLVRSIFSCTDGWHKRTGQRFVVLTSS